MKNTQRFGKISAVFLNASGTGKHPQWASDLCGKLGGT